MSKKKMFLEILQNEQNGGGLIYSAFQVAKCARIYEDWLKTSRISRTEVTIHCISILVRPFVLFGIV